MFKWVKTDYLRHKYRNANNLSNINRVSKYCQYNCLSFSCNIPIKVNSGHERVKIFREFTSRS